MTPSPSARASYERGMAHLKGGAYEAMVAAFTEAIRTKNATSWFAAGRKTCRRGLPRQTTMSRFPYRREELSQELTFDGQLRRR